MEGTSLIIDTLTVITALVQPKEQRQNERAFTDEPVLPLRDNCEMRLCFVREHSGLALWVPEPLGSGVRVASPPSVFNRASEI